MNIDGRVSFKNEIPMSFQVFNSITGKIVLALCSLFRALNGDVCELGNFDSSLIRFSLIYLLLNCAYLPENRKNRKIITRQSNVSQGNVKLLNCHLTKATSTRI